MYSGAIFNTHESPSPEDLRDIESRGNPLITMDNGTVIEWLSGNAPAKDDILSRQADAEAILDQQALNVVDG